MVVPLPDRAVTGAGVFGKLPAHGDFITRGFAPETRDALDSWLSASIAGAREALGGGYEDAFDTAPPWRFVLPQGEGWIAGALAPSVDGVGRRYPILAQVPVDALESGGNGAAHCEAAIYDAFEQGQDADALHAAISQPVAEWDDEWPGRTGWWTMGSEAHALTQERPAGLIRAMLTLPARDEETEGAL